MSEAFEAYPLQWPNHRKRTVRWTVMRHIHNIRVSLLVASLLSACGGGGGSGPSPVVAAPPAPVAPVAADECLPSPYFPICQGSARKYESRQIVSAVIGAQGVVGSIVIGAPVVQGEHLEYNTAVDTCSSYPGASFFEEQWAFGSTVPSMAASYADSVWTAPDGRQYIGEGHGHAAGYPDQVLSAGEPILTLNPVAGETIQTTYEQSLTGCGGQMVPFTPVPFDTKYFTVEHLESFTDAEGKTWADVWHTTLEEWTTAPSDHRYYDYYFARGASLVQADCWTEAPDHYSCGRIDTLIAEAL
jgi:hypothetical protein